MNNKVVWWRRQGWRVCLGAGLLASFCSGGALAAMGNLGTTYGVLPFDVATTQALSISSSRISSLYYNPASLLRDPNSSMTLGMMLAENNLAIDSKGGPRPVNRVGGSTVLGTPARQLIIGLKTDLSSLTAAERPLYFGFMAGIEKYGREMLAFSSTTGVRGQYLQEGQQPLFLLMGGGVSLLPGIDAGLSLRLSLNGTSKATATSDLMGNTKREKMRASGKPDLRPIAGLRIDWGKFLCPQGDCWLSQFETDVVYRSRSNTKTSFAANIIIPGAVAAPGGAIKVSTFDFYQPDIFALGVTYRPSERYKIGATLEMQRWSRLTRDLKSDTIRRVAVNPGLMGAQYAGVKPLKFRDVLVPRLGIEYRINSHYSLSGGISYEQTPLDSDTSLDVNYLGADKLIAGIGLAALFDNPFIFSYPLMVELGYQRQQLAKRDFNILSSDPRQQGAAGAELETVRTRGYVNVFSGSITLRF